MMEDYTNKHEKNNNPKDGGEESCVNIVNALEGLPNDAVPKDSLYCREINFGKGYAAECGVSYSLTFTGNPGYLKQLEIDLYMDKSTTQRSTMFNQKGYAGLNVSTMVYKQGIPMQPDRLSQVEYWATKCTNVKVTTQFAGTVPKNPDHNIWGALRGIETVHEQFELASCLGDSDGITSNNVDVYDFDYATYVGTGISQTFSSNAHGTDEYGSYEKMNGYPHIIKLVPDQTSDQYEPSYYQLVWVSRNYTYADYGLSDLGQVFWLASPPISTTIEYLVYATDGVAEVVFWDSDSDEELDIVNEPRITAYFSLGSKLIYTSYDVSCETGSSYIHPCLDKGDMIFLFDANWGTETKTMPNGDTIFGAGGYHHTLTDTDKPDNAWKDNNYHLNTGTYYTIKKIYKADPTNITFTKMEDRYRIVVDSGINWDADNTTDPDGDGYSNTGHVQIIKFSPATTGNYEYLSECGGRGNCDYDSGICDCYSGYTGLACEEVDGLAV